jgi:hypothetical protein
LSSGTGAGASARECRAVGENLLPFENGDLATKAACEQGILFTQGACVLMIVGLYHPEAACGRSVISVTQWTRGGNAGRVAFEKR